MLTPALALFAFVRAVPLGEYPREEQPEGLSGITSVADGYCCVDDRGGRAYRYDLSFDAAGALTNAVLKETMTLPGCTDLEGCAWDRQNGWLWVSDEARPTIAAFDLATRKKCGEVRLPAEVAASLRHNRAVEGLSIAPDGATLWAANEDTLKIDGEEASRKCGGLIRLMRFVRTQGGGWKFDRHFRYHTDSLGGDSLVGFGVSGVSALCALGDQSLLVLEREFSSKQLFEASFRTRLYQATADAKSGEAAKTLLWEQDSGLVNYEGMCFGPKLSDDRRLLVLVSDGGGIASEYFLTLNLE